MKYIITYRSYKQHYDKEVFSDKAQAEIRYKQLAQCKIVDQLKVQEK